MCQFFPSLTLFASLEHEIFHVYIATQAVVVGFNGCKGQGLFQLGTGRSEFVYRKFVVSGYASTHCQRVGSHKGRALKLLGETDLMGAKIQFDIKMRMFGTWLE